MLFGTGSSSTIVIGLWLLQPNSTSFCVSSAAAHSTFAVLDGLSWRPSRGSIAFTRLCKLFPAQPGTCCVQLAAHVAHLQPCNLVICKPPAAHMRDTCSIGRPGAEQAPGVSRLVCHKQSHSRTVSDPGACPAQAELWRWDASISVPLPLIGMILSFLPAERFSEEELQSLLSLRCAVSTAATVYLQDECQQCTMLGVGATWNTF